VPQLGKNVKPIFRPLFRPVGPRPFPPSLTPRVAQDHEPLPFDLDGFDDGMREVADQTVYGCVFHSAPVSVEGLEPAPKEPVLVCVHELFVPEFVTVEDVLGRC